MEPTMNKQVKVTVRFVGIDEHNGAKITTYKDRVGLLGAKYFTNIASTPTFNTAQKAFENAKVTLDSQAAKEKP
jgi:hypothetical protein